MTNTVVTFLRGQGWFSGISHKNETKKGSQYGGYLLRVQRWFPGTSHKKGTEKGSPVGTFLNEEVTIIEIPRL